MLFAIFAQDVENSLAARIDARPSARREAQAIRFAESSNAGWSSPS